MKGRQGRALAIRKGAAQTGITGFLRGFFLFN